MPDIRDHTPAPQGTPSEQSAAVIERARQWAAHDPCPETQQELLSMIDRAQHDPEAFDALARACAGPLSFGTAGLRAPVGPGESQLNVAVIRRTTYGLCTWLMERTLAGIPAGQPAGTSAGDAPGDASSRLAAPSLVIGCDARHGSEQFQREAARVASALGVRALVLPPKQPTPLTAFSVRALGADAGVMVTASHNPPADNGYKVYLADGIQLIAPHDAQIAAAIESAPPANEIAVDEARIEQVDTRQAYLDRVAARATAFDEGSSPESAQHSTPDVHIVLTAMHGVGADLGARALQQAGCKVTLVAEQAEPDPVFPTVTFPNPEEPGAMDLAIAQGLREGADAVFAYDPDADRLACAVGERRLSGDELGALLGDAVAARLAATGERGTLANSIVSSRWLETIARHHGMDYEATLTGFKWIARAPGLRFGYEEAIGYCVDPAFVGDKDGISASVLLARLIAQLKREGRTLVDQLEALQQRDGVHHTEPLTLRVERLELIGRAMRALREAPPQHLGGEPVAEVRDLLAHPLPCGATDAIMLTGQASDAAPGARVILRPSGTEPKLKCYIDVIEAPGTRSVGTTVAEGEAARVGSAKAAASSASARAGRIKGDLAAYLNEKMGVPEAAS